ncbi:UNVERIFIED_CONTAM: hypothetical protein Sindi_0078500 [Sesamum indicum]
MRKGRLMKRLSRRRLDGGRRTPAAVFRSENEMPDRKLKTRIFRRRFLPVFRRRMAAQDPWKVRNKFLIRLRREKAVTLETPLLGFPEDEQSHIKKTTFSADFPASEDYTETVGGEGTLPMEKGRNLTSNQEGTKVGLQSGAKLIAGHGSCVPASSPLYFNIDEFMNLANKVVEGDETSMAALKDLKIRWEAKFGRCETQATAATNLRKAWRSILPASSVNLAGKRMEEREDRPTTDASISPAAGSSSPTNQTPPAVMAGKTESPAIRSTVTAPKNSAAKDDVMHDVIRADVMHEVMGRADVMHDVMDRADVMHDVMDRADVIHDVMDDFTSNIKDDITIFKAGNDNNTSLNAGIDDVENKIIHDVANFISTNSHVNATPTGLFIAKILLHANTKTIVDDKISQAFNNSSRKTLSYIAPTMQNGEVVVRPTLDTVRDGAKRWNLRQLDTLWGNDHIIITLRNLPIRFGQHFVRLQRLLMGDHGYTKEPGMAMRKLQHTQVPIWIKLRHLPMEYWTSEGLSTVASGVGKPLYLDAITRACTRLDFARVCVMIDTNQKLTKHIMVMTPDEDGGETPCKVDVEYEWLPPKCAECMKMGHTTKECATNKPEKPTKPPNTDMGDVHVERNVSNHDDRGKAIIIYNAFDALHELDDADEIPRGPNICSPLALKDLVSEYRLHLLGILETRVRLNNVIHIQSFILPQWKWFVDYDSVENRICLAWDENFIDVHILNVGEQFVHCRVTYRVVDEPIFITVTYGASEVIARRTLWTTLKTLAQQCSNDPWLVGGDLNAVHDLNEAGLMPLPMQGKWYTWHNCSLSSRSLWKRLDRLLINDQWLARFPMSSYHSLNPRTSDHSPLVIHGDTQQQYGGMFRFDNYLALSSDFIPSVKSIWQHEVVGVPMFAVTRKLKALKPVFRAQKKKKGDLTLNVQLAKGFLEEAQNLNTAVELFLQKRPRWKQIMLQQRAKMQWMKDGDQCSRVFFRKIAHRRVTRKILQINDENGNIHTEQGEIVHEFISYYQNLLVGTRRNVPVDLRYLRPWARHILFFLVKVSFIK